MDSYLRSIHLLNFPNLLVLSITADINRYYPAPHQSVSYASYHVKNIARALDATTPWTSTARHNKFLHNTSSYWTFVQRKTEIAVDKWMSESPDMLPKSLKDGQQAYYRASDSYRGDTGPPEVTISSQTEIGQAEEFVKVPKQRAYTDSAPVISSSLANIPCSCFGIQGLLNLLNATLETSYTLDIPSLCSVLKDCIVQMYDFGTVYGRLRKAWCNSITDIQMELQKRDAEDSNMRGNALVGSRIVKAEMEPRRVWDLYSNRVLPWWTYGTWMDFCKTEVRPISHAWVDEEDRIDVWTPINGYEWPVPIPKGANLDLIRIEMLNLGAEYAWLDVLCLRQRGGPREDLRVEEWKLDVPTIGAMYRFARVVCYLSGLGLPLSLKEGDMESDRCWFRRAWTVQEVGREKTIAGDTPDGPLNAEPIDEVGNYEDKILTRFHKQLKLAEIPFNSVYPVLSAMQDRISTNPVDKVAGLAFSLLTRSIPSYYENQSLEDAWTALVNEMASRNRGILLFTYPEPGTGCKKWRPSWEQVMTKPLPNDSEWINNVWRDDDDWYEGFNIESGFVCGLAVGGEEGIDRCGELIVEDVDGTAHTFNILANHQYPIPEDTYTLLGSHPFGWNNEIHRLQYWVVGRRLPSKMFEKVSVVEMTGFDEIQQLKELGMSAKSRSILA